jgi:hypothetical protein
MGGGSHGTIRGSCVGGKEGDMSAVLSQGRRTRMRTGGYILVLYVWHCMRAGLGSVKR